MKNDGDVQKYSAAREWTKFYRAKDPARKSFPNEYVVKLFMGGSPRITFDKAAYQRLRICDVGCGDGRNLVVFHHLGFEEVHGVEIAQEIADQITERLRVSEDIDASVRVGTNDNIPFEDGYFDYLLSWVACYYMGEQENFDEHVKEFARVLAPGGYLVALIPQPTHFIYNGSEKLRPGYQLIVDDPVGGIRNGEIMRCFKDQADLEKTFGTFFDQFVFGSQIDDVLGEQFDTFLMVARRKA